MVCQGLDVCCGKLYISSGFNTCPRCATNISKQRELTHTCIFWLSFPLMPKSPFSFAFSARSLFPTTEKDDEKSDLGETQSKMIPFMIHLFTAIDNVIAGDEFDDPNIDEDEAIAGILGPPFSHHHIRTALTKFWILEDDSPYPEVRSAVANTDDPNIPVSTLRAWVIGELFCAA